MNDLLARIAQLEADNAKLARWREEDRLATVRRKAQINKLCEAMKKMRNTIKHMRAQHQGRLLNETRDVAQILDCNVRIENQRAEIADLKAAMFRVRAEEREACARIAESFGSERAAAGDGFGTSILRSVDGRQIANAIRARND